MLAAGGMRPQAPIGPRRGSGKTLLDPPRNALQGSRKGGPVLTTTLGEVRATTALAANSRSRLNALYMTSIFIGGAFGSAIASSVYEHGGWLGVMLVGSAFPLVALLRFLSASRRTAVATA